ncbi:MAG: hypothetical protein AAGA68_16545 [Pseudomonadota bacterium]
MSTRFRSSRDRALALRSVFVAAVALAAAPASAQLCTFVVDPFPTGGSGKPAEGFPAIFGPQDHRYVHSSTHLQGNRALEKWAGGLVYNPVPTIFSGFTSAMAIHNPDPSAVCDVDVDTFDERGNPTQTDSLQIPPEQFRTVTPVNLSSVSGVGSARIRVTNPQDCPGIVGTTLMHTNDVAGLVDPDDFTPGASSAQQLQVKPETSELWWGPLPVTSSSAVDFFNGNLPTFWIVNPNDVPNTITIDVDFFDRNTGFVVNLPWRTITLPPNGTLLDITGSHLLSIGGAAPGFFETALSLLLPAVGADLDVTVHVASEQGLPILGDGIMTDFFGDDGADNLALNTRYRMATTMMANDPNWVLVNPDFSFDPGPGGIIQTLMGVSNVGNADAGPVTVQYFDANGTQISSGTQASLPPGQTLRLQPGTLGYPAGQTGFGWVRIRGCTPTTQLVGWTVREVQDLGEPGTLQFTKAYGETLLGITGAEPGNGIGVGNTTRKVKPIGRTTPSFPWPGYMTFVNNSVGNIGRYSFELFDQLTSTSCGSTGLFIGLPWGETSSTYEDTFGFCFGNVSGAVDHATGEIEGIGVLGDPYSEYAIPDFAGN